MQIAHYHSIAQESPCSPSFGSPRNNLYKAKSSVDPLLARHGLQYRAHGHICIHCQDHLPSNHRKLLQAKLRPARPFQEEATNFCYHAGRSYSIPSIRDGLSSVQKLYGHPIQGTILIQEQAFSPEGSTAGKRQSNTLSNHRRQLQQDTISQPAVYQTSLWEHM